MPSAKKANAKPAATEQDSPKTTRMDPLERLERFKKMHGNFEKDGKPVRVVAGKESGARVNRHGHYYPPVGSAPLADHKDAAKFQKILRHFAEDLSLKLPLRQVRRDSNVAYRHAFNPDATGANKDGFVFTKLPEETVTARAAKYTADLREWASKKKLAWPTQV